MLLSALQIGQITTPYLSHSHAAHSHQFRCASFRVSHWNKSSEFTLLTFTTFVPRPKKVKKFFSKFLDTVLIPSWAVEVCCYIKKLILLYRLVL